MRADPNEVTGSPFAGLPAACGSGGGVIATERDGIGIARIAARRGQAAALRELWRAQFGVEPPNAPRRMGRGDVAIAGIAPDVWLATDESSGNDFAASVQSLLGGCAAVTDQSDAYAILRLAGPEVRATLAKLVPIDIHERSFKVGDVAQTLCGYVNVTLWRLEEGPQRGPVFEVWIGRSLAGSVHQAIAHGAARFGFVREPANRPAGEGPSA